MTFYFKNQVFNKFLKAGILLRRTIKHTAEQQLKWRKGESLGHSQDKIWTKKWEGTKLTDTVSRKQQELAREVTAIFPF